MPGRDALGGQGYRPGTAFYIHDHSDGLQVNSVMSIEWVQGIWLHGSAQANDWLISLFQPDVETLANDGNRQPRSAPPATSAGLPHRSADCIWGKRGWPVGRIRLGHSDPDLCSGKQ